MPKFATIITVSSSQEFCHKTNCCRFHVTLASSTAFVTKMVKITVFKNSGGRYVQCSKSRRGIPESIHVVLHKLQDSQSRN